MDCEGEDAHEHVTCDGQLGDPLMFPHISLDSPDDMLEQAVQRLQRLRD